MKKIGDITNTADKNGEFTDGNVAAGTPPTQLMAAWFNSVQREILNVLAKAGIPQSATKEDQLAEAIIQIIGSGNYVTTAAMNLALLKKIDKSNITNQTGNSTELVASQQLITTETGKLASKDELKNTTSQTIFARAITIPLNSDLNDYLNPGLYFQPNGSPGANGKNYPSNTAGSLEVIKTGNTSVKQVYTAWYDNKTWTRRYNGGNKTWADRWDEDFTALNPPTASDVGAYSTQQADAKFQPKGNYLDKDATQEQTTKGFLTAHRRLSVEAPDKARAILYAVESGNVGISAQDSSGKWLGDIKHPANGKSGTLAIVEQLIGDGQKWTDVTSQRQSRVTYTNETSRPILVCVTAYGEAHNVHFLVNDTVVALIGYNSITTIARPVSVIVPAGGKYRISDTIGYTYTWSELR